MDIAQEKRIDDYWNVDENRSLSDPWTGFTKFTPLKETPSKGFLWSGERLTIIQTTTRPDHIWLEAWTRIGKAAQRKEKQEWAIENPTLDNARQLKGIYFTYLNDQEYQETTKNARRKLETLMAPAMPCKRRNKESAWQRERGSFASQ